jgi:predicted phage-related endonuclease
VNAILPTSEAHWHELRASNIGGSEIASLFYLWALPDGTPAYFHMFEDVPEGAQMVGCASPYKTGYRLYYEKAERLPTPPLDGDRILAGQCIEPAIAEMARRKWDWNIRKVNRYIPHPTVRGMAASLDYEEVGTGYPPVEIKNVDGIIFAERWQAETDEITNPPLYITLQLQHQLAVGKAEYGWIVCFVRGCELKRQMIYRHEATLKRTEEAVTAFWKAIDEGREPYGTADYDTIADLWSVETDRQAVDLSKDNRAYELCERFIDLKSQKKNVEHMFDLCKAELGLKIEDASRAELNGYKITWPQIHRKEKQVPAKVQSELRYRGGMQVKEI